MVFTGINFATFVQVISQVKKNILLIYEMLLKPLIK